MTKPAIIKRIPTKRKVTKRQVTRRKASRPQAAASAKLQKLSSRWNMRLYVAGATAKSVSALANLRKICDEHVPGRYRIEVIDLLLKPRLARGDQILAIPTLVRRLPAPMRKIIGDMSNTEAVLVGLDLRKRG